MYKYNINYQIDGQFTEIKWILKRKYTNFTKTKTGNIIYFLMDHTVLKNGPRSTKRMDPYI